MDYAALKAEIQSGPLAAAIAPHIASGNHRAVADALNSVSASFQVPRAIVPSYEIIEAMAPGDWTGVSAAERIRIQVLISAGSVNLSGANTRAAFAAAFGPSTQTRANLIALQTRNGSRAEVSGLGPVTHEDVAIALAS